MKLDKKGWIIFSAWFMLIMLLVMACLAKPAVAAPMAQVTNTPAPTPEISYYYELSSGNSIEVERSISYGQIGIMAALGLVAGLLFLSGLFYLIVHYLY